MSYWLWYSILSAIRIDTMTPNRVQILISRAKEVKPARWKRQRALSPVNHSNPSPLLVSASSCVHKRVESQTIGGGWTLFLAHGLPFDNPLFNSRRNIVLHKFNKKKKEAKTSWTTWQMWATPSRDHIPGTPHQTGSRSAHTGDWWCQHWDETSEKGCGHSTSHCVENAQKNKRGRMKPGAKIILKMLPYSVSNRVALIPREEEKMLLKCQAEVKLKQSK